MRLNNSFLKGLLHFIYVHYLFKQAPKRWGTGHGLDHKFTRPFPTLLIWD